MMSMSACRAWWSIFSEVGHTAIMSYAESTEEVNIWSFFEGGS